MSSPDWAICSRCLAISALMLVTDWRLALASFGVIPFVYWASHVFRAKVRDSYRDVRTRLARINAYLQERITGMRIVQLFGREEAEADALRRAESRPPPGESGFDHLLRALLSRRSKCSRRSRSRA